MALMHIDYYSEVLGRNARMDAIVPEGKAAAEQPWRLLLLLHGMTDDHTIWQRRTTLEEFVSEKNLCVLMPTTYLGFYTNTYRGERYFDHISEEVLRVARALIPCVTRDRRHSYAAGLSMGGYGAFKCALARPDLFSAAASLSGALDVSGMTNLPNAEAMADYWTDTFGPPERIPGSENDLLHLASQMAGAPNRPGLYFRCGTEDFLRSMNRAFSEHLRQIGYAHSYGESAGNHEWSYWEKEIRGAIEWMWREAE